NCNSDNCWSPLSSYTTPPTAENYTLSLHDALPISEQQCGPDEGRRDGVQELYVHQEERQAGRQAMNKTWVTALLSLGVVTVTTRSEEHTSELQSRSDLVCRLLLEKKKEIKYSLQHN